MSALYTFYRYKRKCEQKKLELQKVCAYLTYEK